MAHVEFKGGRYALEQGESILDALLRQDVAIPHGCKAGACQTCLMQMIEGDIPAQAQSGLKETQKELHYFLACACKPKEDCLVDFAGQEETKYHLNILEKFPLNEHVTCLRIESDMEFKAGQYINIWLDDINIRSYSIASVKAIDPYIELHIRMFPDGLFSSRRLQALHEGDTLSIQGPLGECFYSAADKTQPLLLAGISTGLAPLYGIVKDALSQGHTGPMHLVIGAKEANQFYLSETLEELTKQHDNLTISWIAKDANENDQVIEGDIYQFIKEAHPSTKGYKVFLCGAESFVRKLKKQCFLAGANMTDIHADAFLPCGK